MTPAGRGTASPIEAARRDWYRTPMISHPNGVPRAHRRVRRPMARTTLAFAAIGDHARLPARFFARLFASDGRLGVR